MKLSIVELIWKLLTILLISLIILTCSGDNGEGIKTKINCGEVIRRWPSNSTFDEGNLCRENEDAYRRYAFLVKNSITGNERYFCVWLGEYVDYLLGDTYCDDTNLDGW